MYVKPKAWLKPKFTSSERLKLSANEGKRNLTYCININAQFSHNKPCLLCQKEGSMVFSSPFR